jgi:hypothetical protein
VAVVLVATLVSPSPDNLRGFWYAEESFCEQAGISSFHLFVGKRDKSGEWPCHVLIEMKGQLAVDTATTLAISSPFFPGGTRYSIAFKEEIPGIPQTLYADLVAPYKLLLQRDGILYGKMFKDFENSELIEATG